MNTMFALVENYFDKHDWESFSSRVVAVGTSEDVLYANFTPIKSTDKNKVYEYEVVEVPFYTS